LFVPPAPEHLLERKNFAEVHPVLAEIAKTKKTESKIKRMNSESSTKA
jgi:hypothetical protein